MIEVSKAQMLARTLIDFHGCDPDEDAVRKVIEEHIGDDSANQDQLYSEVRYLVENAITTIAFPEVIK